MEKKKKKKRKTYGNRSGMYKIFEAGFTGQYIQSSKCFGRWGGACTNKTVQNLKHLLVNNAFGDDLWFPSERRLVHKTVLIVTCWTKKFRIQ